jgi:hypothetical protein
MQTIADFYMWYWGILGMWSSDPPTPPYLVPAAPLAFLAMSVYVIMHARNPNFLDGMPWPMGIICSCAFGIMWPAVAAIVWGVLMAAPVAIPATAFFVLLYWLAKPRKPKEVVAPDPILEAANAEVEKMLEER